MCFSKAFFSLLNSIFFDLHLQQLNSCHIFPAILNPSDPPPSPNETAAPTLNRQGLFQSGHFSSYTRHPRGPRIDAQKAALRLLRNVVSASRRPSAGVSAAVSYPRHPPGSLFRASALTAPGPRHSASSLSARRSPSSRVANIDGAQQKFPGRSSAGRSSSPVAGIPRRLEEKSPFVSSNLNPLL